MELAASQHSNDSELFSARRAPRRTERHNFWLSRNSSFQCVFVAESETLEQLILREREPLKFSSEKLIFCLANGDLINFAIHNLEPPSSVFVDRLPSQPPIVQLAVGAMWATIATSHYPVDYLLTSA